MEAVEKSSKQPETRQVISISILELMFGKEKG